MIHEYRVYAYERKTIFGMRIINQISRSLIVEATGHRQAKEMFYNQVGYRGGKVKSVKLKERNLTK